MASRISTEDLVKKARQYITSDRKAHQLGVLIENAITDSDRELHEADSLSPLAWDIVQYDELRCVPYAEISAITQASPGVFTAASSDGSITGHGFHDNDSYHQDIVYIDNVSGMDELNNRYFLLEYVSSTTFSLKRLDGIAAINTSGYDEYDSGGVIYHSGFVLNTETILSGITEWEFKKVIPSPTFDGYPTDPVAEQAVRGNKTLNDANRSQRPKLFRYWRNMASPSSSSHYLFWYPPAGTEHNIMIAYQKEVPDITAFTAKIYPFHPPEVHDAIWHGALAKMVGENTRMKRSSDQRIAIRMEVMFAEKWIIQWERDKKRVVTLSREMMSSKGGRRGISA